MATPLVRIDFQDDTAWTSLCDALRAPSPDGYRADLETIDDRKYDGASPEDLCAAFPDAYAIFVADDIAIAGHDNAAIVLLVEDGRYFRVIPTEAWGVENNFYVANMDFDELAEHADEGNVFRGFKES